MKDNSLAYLTTRNLRIDRKLLNSLPIETARRYRLLPVAKEGDQVTIAMADPGDQEARQVVSQAFGDLAYIIQADPINIDYTLASIEPENVAHQQGARLLFWQATQQPNEILAYAQKIAKLFHGEFILSAQSPNDNTLDGLINEIKNAPIDLLLVDTNTLPIRETKLIDAIPISILFTRTPYWPIKKILLVLTNEPNDDFTLDWALQLAYASQASLTVLPVLAPIPQMYAPGSKIQHSLSQLLTSNCPLSERMRAVSQQIVTLNIDGVFHLRYETPQRQISAEVADGNYDLVVLAAEQQNLYRRWLVAELVSPLLGWISCPVLVAKSSLSQSVI